MSDAFWIILIGFLVGGACSLLGCFLILRKMAMLGDAVSHSVLFGIVVSFLVTGSRAPIPMFLGAVLVGLFTSYCTTFLNNHGRVQEDASIGVTFTFLFAAGVVLLSLFATHIDLDQDCVLYGELALAPLDTVEFRGLEFGPRAVWILGAVLGINLLLVVLGFSQLKPVSFDPLLASSIVISVQLWHYLLMSAVAVTAVAAFDSVGAILVVAMFVVPANTAFLMASSLPKMLMFSMLYSLLSSVGGYYLSMWFNSSVSAAMVLVAGVILFIVVVVQSLRYSHLNPARMIFEKNHEQ